jgi:CBS domain-containing protein
MAKVIAKYSRLTVLFTILLKVMTPHPDSATLDTTILDALHIMHDGKFLHIPVTDGGKTLFFSA